MRTEVNEVMLVKYLLNELTAGERTMVNAWLAESDANQQTYQQIKLIWQQSHSIAAPPAIDEDAAWQRFKSRVQNSNGKGKSYPFRDVIKIAAALLLLVAGNWLAMYLPQRKNSMVVSSQSRMHGAFRLKPNYILAPPPGLKAGATGVIPDTDVKMASEEQAQKSMPNTVAAHTRTIEKQFTTAKKIATQQKRKLQINTTDELEKLICNSTQCPIQICITQTVNCNGSKPATVATCTTLEADQSGELCFKTFTHSCNIMVDEISITKLSTGETIVLNAKSTPATAQDVFNYITGYKQGSITAGLFHSDCNNDGACQGLTLENNYGNLQLQ